MSRVLRPADAQALYQHLSQELEYGLILGTGARREYVCPERCKHPNAAQERALYEAAYATLDWRDRIYMAVGRCPTISPFGPSTLLCWLALSSFSAP